MHVVVVGAGAVGKLYGGWLMAGGVDVSFVARGGALAALRRDGLSLRGARGDLFFEGFEVSDLPRDLRPADAVILAVKLYDLDDAVAAARVCAVDGGLVVGLQNGVNAFERIRRRFPSESIAVGPVYSAAVQSAAAIVEYSGRSDLVVLGSPSGGVHPATRALIEGWRRAGVEAEISSDIENVLWTKFLAFATNAALTCLARQPAGVVYRDPDLLLLARESVREIMLLASAEGVKLATDAEDATIRLLQSFPHAMVASMRQDLDAGRRLELDDITGAIVEMGRRRCIPTPIHATAYACLKPYRDGLKS